MNLSSEDFERQYQDVVSKECLCIGLSNPAVVKYGLPPIKNLKAVTICPGPNIAYFNKLVSLQEMTDHIYGRANILVSLDRPHMFIKELKLNVDYLKEQLFEVIATDVKKKKDLFDFARQLLTGIEYYRSISAEISRKDEFNSQLRDLESEIHSISAAYAKAS